MNSLKAMLRTEARVAFSRRAQPVWFRVVKWSCIIVGAQRYHDRSWFWWTLAGLATAGTILHLIYRRKTNVWTRAWGGWNDLAALRD